MSQDNTTDADGIPNKLLTVAWMMHYFSLSRDALTAQAARGELPAPFKQGSRLYWRPSVIREHLRRLERSQGVRRE